MKKSKNIIAVASGDFHLHKWIDAYPNNRDRLFDSMQPLVLLGKIARKLDVPLLFTGDLIHKPKAADNEVLEIIADTCPRYIDIFGIDGNHDQCRKNTPKHPSPNYIKTLSKFLPKLHWLGDGTIKDNGKLMVAGISYLTHNKGFKNELAKRLESMGNLDRFKILLIHTDLPGAKTSQGFKVNDAEEIKGDLDEYFKGFDLVLCGHIHKPQILSKKVIMLGSPAHQNKGDMGIDMGYWEIYSDKSYKFVPLDLPKYVYYEGKRPEDENNIYIPKNKLSSLDLTIALSNSFDNTLSRTSIAKNYLNERKIKDKDKRKALIITIKKS